MVLAASLACPWASSRRENALATGASWIKVKAVVSAPGSAGGGCCCCAAPRCGTAAPPRRWYSPPDERHGGHEGGPHRRSPVRRPQTASQHGVDACSPAWPKGTSSGAWSAILQPCAAVIQPRRGPGQIDKGADLDIADPAGIRQIVSKAMGVDVERLVRTPARQHLDVEAAVRRPRWRRGADRPAGSSVVPTDVHLFHDAAGRKVRAGPACRCTGAKWPVRSAAPATGP